MPLLLNSSSDYGQINLPGLPQGNAPRTIEAWVQDNNADTRAIEIFFSYGPKNGYSQGFTLSAARFNNPSFSHPMFIGWAHDVDLDPNARPQSELTLSDGTWHRMNVVYDGNSLTMYRDGVQIWNGTYAPGYNKAFSTLNTAGTTLLLGGGTPNDGEYYFSGKIQQVKVWNTALSAAQIQGAVSTLNVNASLDQLPASQNLVTYLPLVNNTSDLVSGRSLELAGAASVEGSPVVTPTYSINHKGVSTGSTINEGETAYFNVTTTHVAAGTLLPYTITGVSAADLAGVSLTGNATVGVDGKAVIAIPLAADKTTEGREILTVTVQNISANVSVSDTSVSDISVSTPIYNASNGHWYSLATAREIAWADAMAGAAKYSHEGQTGYLATIGSASENTFIQNLVATDTSAPAMHPLWIWLIGLSDQASEGRWVWQAGPEQNAVATYTNFYSDEGLNATEDFVAMNPSSGKWADLGSAAYSGTGGFVIEYGASQPNASYTLTSTASTVDEGSNATFTLNTTNVPSGTSVNYTVTGVSSADIVSGGVNGSVVVGASGVATITVPITADNLTEGNENLVVTVAGKSASTLVLDTSKEMTASYAMTPSTAAVNEGGVATFTVQGTNVKAGSTVAYRLSGLDAEDIAGGQVNGRVVFDELGMATISVPVVADSKTEGSESLTVTIGSATSTITINDTSKSTSQYYLSAADGLVQEGKVATFIVSAVDASLGTKIAYTISGAGVTARDIANGKLSGSVAMGADSSATITVSLAADKLTEGDEDLTVTLTGLGVSETITIDDTSTDTPLISSYVLSAVESSVKEGEDAEFFLETDPSQAGKQFKWTITGVSTSDVVGKKLTGSVTIEDDGTATITVPTAVDALTEGNETLTLTVNGQKAGVAVLDDNSIKVASTLLTGVDIAVYKTSSGNYVLSTSGLSDGDALDDYVPLMASAMKAYTPKAVSAILSYEDGSYGLIGTTGTGSKISYSEQKFSEDGVAKGKATKLTAAQILSKENLSQIDINGDGTVGEAINLVLDGDGDANQQDYGLYKTSSGTVVLGEADLSEGDSLGDTVTLMASKTKAWVIPSGSVVAGIAITDGGSLEVLTLKGRQYSAQKFDADTGLLKSKAAVLKTAQVDAREYYYDIDLTGDDDISAVGVETLPAGWTV